MLIRWFAALPAHRKVLLFLSGGMLTLVFDAFIAHFSWNRGTMTWNQWIPVIYGMVAFVHLGALALKQFSPGSENAGLLANGIIGLIVGGVGVVLHGVEFWDTLDMEALTFTEIGKTLAIAPPIFAPAAYAGVGLLLMVIKRLTGARRAELEARLVVRSAATHASEPARVAAIGGDRA